MQAECTIVLLGSKQGNVDLGVLQEHGIKRVLHYTVPTARARCKQGPQAQRGFWCPAKAKQ
jgi:hypothetical protein